MDLMIEIFYKIFYLHLPCKTYRPLSNSLTNLERRNMLRAEEGNTSYKDESTLWVKPSGTTLAGLQEDTFVTLNRAKVNGLYDVETPEESHAREELVKNFMGEAVLNDAGRPSVEAPLHNILETKFVVHTHALLVNGMTCAKDGESVCKRLFPDALWVEYIDAGVHSLHGIERSYRCLQSRVQPCSEDHHA